MSRQPCDECNRSHNTREGARRCHARAIRDADLEREARKRNCLTPDYTSDKLYSKDTGGNMKTKTRQVTKAEALLELNRAIIKAHEAGGETIGIENGLEPLITASNLAEQIEDGTMVAWDTTYVGLRTSRYGEFVGYIKIVQPYAMTSSNYPVRKAVA